MLLHNVKKINEAGGRKKNMRGKIDDREKVEGGGAEGRKRMMSYAHSNMRRSSQQGKQTDTAYFSSSE